MLTCCKGCKKDKEEKEAPAPPPPGGASAEMVSTGLGMGLGLDAHLAPTSTRWQRVLTQGDKIAVIAGGSLDDAIALRTADGGRSWTALKTPAEGAVARWSMADDGAVVLALGRRAKAKVKGGTAPIESMQLFFAEPQQSELTGPVPLFPKGSAPEGAAIPMGGSAQPAAWSGPAAALLVSLGRGKPAMAYGVPAGRELAKSEGRLPTEDFVTAPYGRPPSLLSLRGGTLFVRPWPKAGDKLEPPSPVPGFRASGTASQQLSEGPTCESGPWSFRLVQTNPRLHHLVGISPNRALAVKLPLSGGQLLGCSPDAVVVQSPDPQTKNPRLVRCSLDGKCTEPQSPPFRYWPEDHKRTILATATPQGVVATMAARTGPRWGLYLGQSLDQGKLFELPRVIGEGASDRGYLEIGAIVSWPKRTLLLVSADVTGTTRRGWYVLASDDGGTNWGPP